MRLILSRAVPADFDVIVPLQFKIFAGPGLHAVFFGHPTPQNIANAKAKLLHDFANDPADVWLKVTDEDEEVEYDILDDNGKSKGKAKAKRIVCACNYKVYPTFVDPDPPGKANVTNGVSHSEKQETQIKKQKQEFTWLDTPQEREDAEVTFNDFMSRRRRACVEGHILMFMLYVDSDYQRKGAGSMAVKWGCELADQLMLPCWVESSKKGHGLYSRYGYEDKEEVRFMTKSFENLYTRMRRPVKVKGFRGKDMERF